MKEYEDRIYRKSKKKPTLETLRYRLSQCRQDYERYTNQRTLSPLKETMWKQIKTLEAEIAEIEKTAPPSIEDITSSQTDSHDHKKNPLQYKQTRVLPERFRPPR